MYMDYRRKPLKDHKHFRFVQVTAATVVLVLAIALIAIGMMLWSAQDSEAVSSGQVSWFPNGIGGSVCFIAGVFLLYPFRVVATAARRSHHAVRKWQASRLSHGRS